MKTKTVQQKLGRFRNYQDNKRGMIYQSRANLNKIIRVVDQDGLAVCLPIEVEEGGNERIVFHAKTIKSLVEFLENK